MDICLSGWNDVIGVDGVGTLTEGGNAFVFGGAVEESLQRDRFAVYGYDGIYRCVGKCLTVAQIEVFAVVRYEMVLVLSVLRGPGAVGARLRIEDLARGEGRLIDARADVGEPAPGVERAESELVALGSADLIVGHLFVYGGKIAGIVYRRDALYLFQLGGVGGGQEHEEDDGGDRPYENEGRPLPSFAPASVGQRPEEGEHEERQDVVDSHYDAGQRLGHSESVGEDLGDDRVVSLPESAYQEKCESDEQCALVVQFQNCHLAFRCY